MRVGEPALIYCCTLGPVGGCFLQRDRVGRKYGFCFIKAHQSSSGGLLEQSKGDLSIWASLHMKLKQVKSKCQFKAWLIKAQKHKAALLQAKNSPCCQVSPQHLSQALWSFCGCHQLRARAWRGSSTDGAFNTHQWAQVSLKLGKAGRKHWIPPCPLGSRNSNPSLAAVRTCAAQIWLKNVVSTHPKTQCRMNCFKTEILRK